MSPAPPERERLADADRDRLAEALGRHYVEGRLDAAALDARVGAVYGATFRDEAQAALDGLPEAEPRSGGAVEPRRRRGGWLRRRGHGESDRAQAGWRPTPERFVDPTTGRVI